MLGTFPNPEGFRTEPGPFLKKMEPPVLETPRFTFSTQNIRAALPQNKTAPENKKNHTEKRFEKREKRSEKRSETQPKIV